MKCMPLFPKQESWSFVLPLFFFHRTLEWPLGVKQHGFCISPCRIIYPQYILSFPVLSRMFSSSIQQLEKRSTVELPWQDSINISGFLQKYSNSLVHRFMPKWHFWNTDIRCWNAKDSFFTGWVCIEKHHCWILILTSPSPPQKVSPSRSDTTVISLLQTPQGRELELGKAQVLLKEVIICPLSCGNGCKDDRTAEEHSLCVSRTQ